MYLRWFTDPGQQKDIGNKTQDIIQKHKEVKANVIKLRKQLMELVDEAKQLGILKE